MELQTLGANLSIVSRETDDIRIATGQTFGQSIEVMATVIASLILAFVSCWSLTMVILASIPLTAVLVGFVQSRATPLHESEMENMARASNILERSIQSITTIKAFTTEKKEKDMFMQHVDKATATWNRLAFIYGGRMGLTATLTLAMFTSGFWYGSHLVQAGKASPGAVITTFWSCLLAGNGLTTAMTSLSLIEIGQVSAASLIHLISDDVMPEPQGEDPFVVDMDVRSSKGSSFASLPAREEKFEAPSSPRGPNIIRANQRHFIPMRRIRPGKKCQGEINVKDVTFSYPSRPNEPVLQNVSMFFPAGETTFIIGGSGSGKSTLSHLLLRLYDGYSGQIYLDDQDVRFLDAEWTRSHIAALDQSAIIFDMSIRDNVALGHCGKIAEEVTYKANHVPLVESSKIVDACKMALLNNDIQKLEYGYDTLLGSGGIDLSGGQKQRLALARAIIRDPTVLILDECTSALDVKSRLLITAFIKKWRRGKTTIMITHDLQQVDEEDFVYLLENGRLVEQGYRMDLSTNEGAHFANFIRSQRGVNEDVKSVKQRVDFEEEQMAEELNNDKSTPTGLEWRASKAVASAKSNQLMSGSRNSHARMSRWALENGFDRPFQFSNTLPSYVYPDFAARESAVHHPPSFVSSVYSVSSTLSTTPKGLRPLQLPQEQQSRALEKEESTETLEMVSVVASMRRREARERKAWNDEELDKHFGLASHDRRSEDTKHQGYIDGIAEGGEEMELKDRRTLISALFMSWRTQPNKVVLVIGFIATALGAMTHPTFSFVLGKLLATMGSTGQENLVLRYSLIVLGLAFIDGALQFLRFAILQYCANIWIRSLRDKAFAKIFSQDKAWFDKQENNSSALLTKLIKDGEDAKSFISRIIGELILVVVLTTTAFVWSFIESWQLTLAGAAMGPIFYGVVVVQSRLISRFERQNKLQRERVSKRIYNMLHNIRGIRSMSLEKVFYENYQDSVQWAERYGLRSAPLSGFGYGLKDAGIYFAEALLYYVGAVLLINGKLSLSGMLIVFNLILFAVSYAAQIMAFLPGIAKSLQAVHDLVTILNLNEADSLEYVGRATPLIHGKVTFHNVDFSYPTRKHEKVLDGCSFEIQAGEKVALVGQSGCGKSTVAALLCRIYEPDHGLVLLDNEYKLSSIQTNHLRNKLAFVQQKSDLFDDTIRNNILYGNQLATEATLQRAIKQSCCDDVIQHVENGIETVIGDKASNISGGQKQRIALARALVRDEAKILILDECTSALDVTNQERVAQSLLGDKSRRVTTLVVTHKLEMMKRCNRILVLEKGRVVQSGHFSTLLQEKGGAFSKLANAGEWGA